MSRNFSLRPGDNVLEIGPVMGFGTVKMSRLVGKEGRVVSVEADEKAFGVLKMNIEQNSITNAIVSNYAIGDENKDKVTFLETGMQANSLVRMKGAKREPVTMRKVTTAIEETGLTPNFMILTINGYELNVLQSCKNFLNECRLMRMIVTGWYSDEEGRFGPRIIDLLKSVGFRVIAATGMHVFAFNP